MGLANKKDELQNIMKIKLMSTLEYNTHYYKVEFSKTKSTIKGSNAVKT